MDIGPFEIDSPLGRGAMGEVYRARFGPVDVAVKVLTAELARRPARREAFRREVLAVARLDHPAIVAIYDVGETDDGAPWMAMELASDGTLAEHPPATWSELRSLLLVLLDALAHAHARDLVHRDLKPANVLACGPTDARPGWKLADFGISAVVGAPDALGGAGTPRYMAPEQFARSWRTLGPWTDLYALGCLAFALAHGAPPFRGTPPELAAAHASAPPPRLVPRLPVPDGFEAWLGTALAKDPRARWVCAADAAAALHALGDTSGGVAAPWPELAPTLTHLATAVEVAPLVVAPAAGGPRLERAPAPLPARLGASPEARSVRGLGLGLYGLRRVPLVGREAELDALWAQLVAASASGATRAVLVHGPADIGKTRLAESFLHRARAAGCRGLVSDRAAHDPVLGALRAALAATDLTGPALREHLQGRLGSDDLAAALDGATGAPGRTWGAVRVWAGERPAVLLLDDVVRDRDALALVAAASGHPAVLVLTARDEELAEDPDLVARLDALELVRIALGPLPERAWPALSEALLGVSHAVAGRLAARAAGVPGAAVQLAADWVERGLLAPSAVGLVLRDGDTGVLPGAPEWTARLERVSSGRDADEALELAAALGPDVDRSAWERVSGRAWPELEAELERRALVTPVAGGFRFVHTGLVRALRVRAGPRWPEHHARCAAVVGDPERRALHLLAAGRHADAVDPLLAAAFRRHTLGHYHRARDLFARRTAAMDAAAVSEDDPRWADGWTREAVTWRFLGDFGRCEALGARVEAHGRRTGRPDTEADGISTQAIAAISADRLQVGVDMLERAIALATDPRVRARARTTRGAALTNLWRLDEAEADLQASVLPDAQPLHLAEVWRLLGGLAYRRGDIDELERALARSAALYAEVGDPWGEAMVLGDRAVAHHVRGDLETAATLYEDAIRRWRALGTDEGLVPMSNLSIARALQGRDREALAGALRVEARAGRTGRRNLLSMAHAVQLAACAGLADCDGFDRAAAAAGALVDPVVEEDMPQLAALAAERWAARGDLARQRTSLALGARWRGLIAP